MKRNVLILAAIVGAAGATFGVLSAGSGRGEVGVAVAAQKAEGYKVDAVHSAVVFRILHQGVGPFWGRFNEIEGTFNLDSAAPDASTLEFTVNTASVDTNHNGRDDHLRNPDFFNAKQFPTATFKSTSVKSVGDGAFTVTGDFTLCGVTKPVEVAVTGFKTGSGRGGEAIAGFEATFTVKRSEFGVSTYPGALGEDVKVIVGIEGVR